MEDNPYQPPATAVADIDAVSPRSAPYYFPVSIAKLIVLSVTTFGVYEVVWFYWHWRTIKTREHIDISPVPRSIFAVLFCYSLFSDIRKKASEDSGSSPYSAGALAVAWILLTLAARLPDPYWVVTLLSFVPLVPVQRAANEVNQKTSSAYDPNARFTGWNILFIVLGSIVIVLALIGLGLDGGS